MFPANLSPRQFRLAFKNLVRIASPPSAIAAAQPLLAPTLLELIHERAIHASSTPLAPDATFNPPLDAAADEPPPAKPQSEQAVLTLTLIDTLPTLPLDLLQEWLPLSAALVHHIPDAAMRDSCRAHFWETLVSSEMNAERSHLCVAWWTTKGGREMLLGHDLAVPYADDGVLISGALPAERELAKL